MSSQYVSSLPDVQFGLPSQFTGGDNALSRYCSEGLMLTSTSASVVVGSVVAGDGKTMLAVTDGRRLRHWFSGMRRSRGKCTFG